MDTRYFHSQKYEPFRSFVCDVCRRPQYGFVVPFQERSEIVSSRPSDCAAEYPLDDGERVSVCSNCYRLACSVEENGWECQIDRQFDNRVDPLLRLFQAYSEVELESAQEVSKIRSKVFHDFSNSMQGYVDEDGLHNYNVVGYGSGSKPDDIFPGWHMVIRLCPHGSRLELSYEAYMGQGTFRDIATGSIEAPASDEIVADLACSLHSQIHLYSFILERLITDSIPFHRLLRSVGARYHRGLIESSTDDFKERVRYLSPRCFLDG